MSDVKRMDIDTVRSQQTQVAAVLQVLATILLCLATLLVVDSASDRARAQDETFSDRVIAARYHAMLMASEDEDAAPIRLAALTLAPSEEEGAVLLSRSLNDLRTYDASHFESAADFSRELNCLAEAIYYEARSERFVGQLAVAQVVMNRVRHSAWPDTLCGVVYEGSERRTGCQFTFTCDGSLYREPYGRGWIRSQLVAEHAYLGFGRDVTRRATHYHTVAVDPYWNDSLVHTRTIGTHIFYRFPTRRERASGVVLMRDA